MYFLSLLENIYRKKKMFTVWYFCNKFSKIVRFIDFGKFTLSTKYYFNNLCYITAAGLESLADFRSRKVEEGPQQVIEVDRLITGDKLTGVLRVYKSRTLSLTRKPMVIFTNEPGQDVGAVALEYFAWGMEILQESKFDNMPLFEGEKGHLLPCANRCLLVQGIFEIVGKFIAHSILHGGPGMTGVSSAVSAVVTGQSIEQLRNDPPVMSVRDLPDAALQILVNKVSINGNQDPTW
jgi:hypothetical protein